MENKVMLNDIVSLLFGLDIEAQGYYSKTASKSNRKTIYYRSRMGLFGHPLCVSGVTESHAALASYCRY
jgi:hypothetical protein